MGYKFIDKNLKSCILFFLVFCPISCGEYLGFSSPPEPDLGDIKKIRLYLSEESLNKLNDTMGGDFYAPCIYEEENFRQDAEIRIRGASSRLEPKRSFTIRLNDEEKYALEALGDFYMTNRLAMSLYRRVGLPAPEIECIALFINNIYIGVYNKIYMYKESELTANYFNKAGEFFKCHISDMGNNLPLYDKSEKKFPDDNDFYRLNILIYNATNMNDTDWFNWVNENVNSDDIVKYMVIHDFLAMRDTYKNNFCIYYYGQYVILPWDHDFCMKEPYPPIGGVNILTTRLLQEPNIRSKYNTEFKRLFMDPGNIINDLLVEVNDYYNEMHDAVLHDPNIYSDYDKFLSEKDRIDNFIINRSSQIPDPPLN